MIDIEFRNSIRSNTFPQKFFLSKVKKTFALLKLKGHYELSINVVGRAKIASLNGKYRGKKGPTDVLSFPIMDRIIRQNSKVGDIIPLGDIFICLPVARQKANKEGGTVNSVVEFLLVHGLLHLLGYDHEKSFKEEKEMFALQDKLLRSDNS